MKISICFGSACYLRGSYGVLNAFQALIKKYNLQTTVDIEGGFCHGNCTAGVVIRINDEVITNVSEDNVADIFKQKVLGSCQCEL